jgi:hypothetical protein
MEKDLELEAIAAVVAALNDLDAAQLESVMAYVSRRFGIAHSSVDSGPAGSSAETSPQISATPAAQATIRTVTDIRTLKEEKAPKSANEMATLVAYYLSELAPESERRPEVAKGDIEKYFKAGSYKLTADAGQTLINAKNAGYLEAGARGQYRLNPVGYNLVVHRMGAQRAVSSTKSTRKPPGRKAVAAKKMAAKKK